MATIETKYSVGDTVYHAGTTTERKQHPCPDCKGTRFWSATSPAGAEYKFACPRCSTQYSSFDDLRLDYTAAVPAVTRRTIGSIEVNTARDAYNHGPRYMCIETGVGSGSVYEEASLFETEEEALAAATLDANARNTEEGWISKQYDKTLSVKDYQLDAALLKRAKDESSRANSMLWNLGNLFATIEEAADKDAILEAVDDYKNYDWARDKQTSEKEAA